jgi:hypothetical protein
VKQHDMIGGVLLGMTRKLRDIIEKLDEHGWLSSIMLNRTIYDFG